MRLFERGVTVLLTLWSLLILLGYNTKTLAMQQAPAPSRLPGHDRYLKSGIHPIGNILGQSY